VTSWSHGDASEFEITKFLIISSHLSFSLQHCDSDLGLVVGGGRESLRFLSRDSSVSVDESSENTSHGLDTQREGSNIEKKHVLDISSEHGTLYGSSNSDSLIWVDSLVGGFSEEFLDLVLHLWHSSHTSDQQNLVDLVLSET